MSTVEIGGCRKDTFLGLSVGDRVSTRVAVVSDRAARASKMSATPTQRVTVGVRAEKTQKCTVTAGAVQKVSWMALQNSPCRV